jgi:hypothetical protein
LLGQPLRQRRELHLRPRAEWQGLRQLENLHEDVARPFRVDRRPARLDPKFHAPGGDDPQQRVGSRLAAAAYVGIEDRAWNPGAARQLGLTEAALTLNVSDQRSG